MHNVYTKTITTKNVESESEIFFISDLIILFGKNPNFDQNSLIITSARNKFQTTIFFFFHYYMLLINKNKISPTKRINYTNNYSSLLFFMVQSYEEDFVCCVQLQSIILSRFSLRHRLNQSNVCRAGEIRKITVFV